MNVLPDGTGLAFGSVATKAGVEIAMPILYTNKDKQKDRVNIFDLIWPVGTVIVTTSATPPFWGTWAAWGAGRVPVGIDTSQTEFNTVNKTDGAKTNTLTAAQMPSHTHTQNAHAHSAGRYDGYVITNAGVAAGSGQIAITVDTGSTAASSRIAANNTTATNQNTGGGGAHNNLQPYIVSYMWRRTA
jgi:hypothetical protein